MKSVALLGLALLAGCASAPSDDALVAEGQLGTGTHSMLGFAHVPRQVLLPIQVNDGGFSIEVYRIVQSVNAAERLSGKDGPNAEISVVGWLANEDQMLLGPTPEAEGTPFTAEQVKEGMLSKLRAMQKLAPTAPVPGLELVRTDGLSNFAFMQDAFEIFAVAAPEGGPRLALLDLGNPTEGTQTSMMNEAFRKHFGAATIPAALAPTSLATDDDGGNIEVTHEGRPYLGSRTSVPLRSSVEKLTGQAPLVLPTDWLFVGHVDEYVTILPSDGECGATVVYADPLEALNIIRQRKAVPVIPMEDIEGTGVTSRNRAAYKESLFSSLERFVKPEAKSKPVLELSDFDVSKSVRDPFTIPNLDVELLGNLNAHREIQKGLATLRTASKCLKETVGVPSLFERSASGDPALVKDEILTGYRPVAGYVNLVSLRGHVIIAKEREDFFGPIVRERLGKILGDPARVHEIDASFYEQGGGSVHCTTNVVRAPERWRK